MGFKTPNQSLTGIHAGHSSQPTRGTPSDGMAVPGRATAHPGRIAPPNATNRFTLPTPPASQFPAAPKKLGQGDIPVNPWNPSGMPNVAASTPDDLKPPKPGR